MPLGKGPAEGALLRETEQGGDFAERQLRVLQVAFGQLPAGIVQQLLEAQPLFAQMALQGARRAVQLAGQVGQAGPAIAQQLLLLDIQAQRLSTDITLIKALGGDYRGQALSENAPSR